MIRIKISLLAAILGLTSQASDIDILQNMSMEELLNVKVTTPSLYAENKNQAPGIITVVTADEIKSFGARHLRDVLDRIVGMQIIGSHHYAHNVASIRGVNSTLTEDNVLVLINGRPVRQTGTGIYNADIYLGFPLDIIDHIEVIRGPGSVLYGTNAMAGVINIIVKEASSAVTETAVSIGIGSFGRKQITGTTLFGGRDYGVTLGVNHIQARGDDVENVRNESGNMGTYGSKENSNNIAMNGWYKQFKIDAMVLNDVQDSHASAFYLPTQEASFRKYFLDFGYRQAIAPLWDISVNYTRNKSTTFYSTVVPSINKQVEKSDLIETNVYGRISDDFNLVLGGNYAIDGAEFDVGLPYHQTRRQSLYAQADYRMWENQKWIAGVQWNKPEKRDAHVSPRFGFVQGFGNNWWLKALYSEAYRGPTDHERYVATPTLRGNPELLPVTIATTDLQVIYENRVTFVALGLYHSSMKNLITRNSDPVPQEINEGSLRFQGIEFEGKQVLTSNWKLTGNANYQTNKTDGGIKDSTFAPSYMIKAGIEYSGLAGTNIAVFNSYIGSSTDLNATGDTPLNNPRPQAYNLLSANITMDAGKLWGLGKPGHSSIGIYLDNLLDEDIYAPDLLHRNKNNSIPDHWGRGINVSYTYKF